MIRNKTLLVLLTVGFFLRVFRLDSQSLWGDELISIYRGLESLDAIAQNTLAEGVNPPLYYYLLHFWLLCAGKTEFAARYLSLLFGTLVIPTIYVTARRTLGRLVGTLSALLATFSPFYVYYSQETRMYAQVTLLSLLSTYLFVRLMDPRSKVQLNESCIIKRFVFPAAYAFISASAIMTHYFAIFVFIAHGLLGVLGLLREYQSTNRRLQSIRWAQYITWIASLMMCILLITPWFLYASQRVLALSSVTERGAVPLSLILKRVLLAFSTGVCFEEQFGLALGIGFLILACFGLIRSLNQTSFWLVLLGVSVLAIYFVSFLPHPGWERYFLVSSPAWFILVANGIAGLIGLVRVKNKDGIVRHVVSGTIQLSVLGFILYANGLGLQSYYFDIQYSRFDWRGAFARLEKQSLPTDAVIFNAPPASPEFDYYFRGTLARYDLPGSNPFQWQQIETSLRRIVKMHTGVWLIKSYPPYYDPDSMLECWLAQYGYRVSSEWVENMTFSFFLMPQNNLSVIKQKVHIDFAEQITLSQVDLAFRPSSVGRFLQIDLMWQAQRLIAKDYKVFAHVVDKSGRIITQQDSQPVGGCRPTSGWRTGQFIQDRLGILILSDLESLYLRIGLYDPEDGKRLNISNQSVTKDYWQIEIPIVSK